MDHSRCHSGWVFRDRSEIMGTSPAMICQDKHGNIDSNMRRYLVANQYRCGNPMVSAGNYQYMLDLSISIVVY